MMLGYLWYIYGLSFQKKILLFLPWPRISNLVVPILGQSPGLIPSLIGQPLPLEHSASLGPGGMTTPSPVLFQSHLPLLSLRHSG